MNCSAVKFPKPIGLNSPPATTPPPTSPDDKAAVGGPNIVVPPKLPNVCLLSSDFPLNAVAGRLLPERSFKLAGVTRKLSPAARPVTFSSFSENPCWGSIVVESRQFVLVRFCSCPEVRRIVQFALLRTLLPQFAVSVCDALFMGALKKIIQL